MFHGYVNQRVNHPIGERIIKRVNQFSHENWLVVGILKFPTEWKHNPNVPNHQSGYMMLSTKRCYKNGHLDSKQLPMIDMNFSTLHSLHATSDCQYCFMFSRSTGSTRSPFSCLRRYSTSISIA